MIDREKVIDALMCWRDAAAFQKWTGDCDSCAFAKSKAGDCIDIAPIIAEAVDLLKADRIYLLDKDEKIKKLHLLLNTKLSSEEQEESVPLKPLAEWLAGYAAPPRNAMMQTLTPGGYINHESLTAAWVKVLEEIR